MEDSSIVNLPSGVEYEVLQQGEGNRAGPGARVTVHYEGFLADGDCFDSSLDRGQPFTFTLGAGDVIPGWDYGICGMQTGEIRRLWIPAELGYGESEVDGIPPNSDLTFEIELVSFLDRPGLVGGFTLSA